MMPALSLSLLVVAAPVEVTFTVSEPLPAHVEVARLTRVATPWQIAEVRQVEVRSGRFVLPGPAGVETVVLVRVPGRPGYLLEGPLRWPSEPATVAIDPEWRRTIRGRYPSGGDLAWVSAGEAPRVLCEWTLPETWECLGVPRSVAGIVVRVGAAGLFYSIVGALGPRKDVEDVRTASAAWGRLVVIEDLHRSEERVQDGAIRARALRLYRPSARPGSRRFEVVPDTRIHIDAIGGRALWITGPSDPTETWLELTVPDVGAGRIDVSELAAGPPDAVLPVALQPPIAVFGRVTGPLAVPAAGAIVSLYRFGIEMRSQDTKKMRRERIAVGEQRTDEDGVFTFSDLPAERYELLAVHSAYGRAVKIIEPHTGEVQLRLEPPPVIEGRVLRGGAPQVGVDVVFVPDLAAFAAAEDPTDLRGGETETDADGRFRVFAAIAGTGELKIGSAPNAIKRVPLPAAEALPPVTELGDIELDVGAAVAVVFEEARECAPIFTGPVGRTGLTVVRSTRLGPAMFSATLPEPGRWNIVALCGGRERRVVPSAIDVDAVSRETSVSLRWP